MICDSSNNDPHVQIYENALSKEWCEKIIKIFDENEHLHKDGIIASGLDKNVKKTKEMYFHNMPLNVYDKYLFDNLHNYLIKYGEHNNIQSKLKCDIDDTGYQLQKYIANDGFYKWHSDSAIEIRNNKISNRIITYLWYLNDVEEGGETLFENFKIKPKQGSLLLFPSTWTYKHSAAMPISNDKYIITGWIWDNIDIPLNKC